MIYLKDSFLILRAKFIQESLKRLGFKLPLGFQVKSSNNTPVMQRAKQMRAKGSVMFAPPFAFKFKSVTALQAMWYPHLSQQPFKTAFPTPHARSAFLTPGNRAGWAVRV